MGEGGGATTTACGTYLPGTEARQPRLQCDVVPFVLEENISFMKLIQLERAAEQKKECGSVVRYKLPACSHKVLREHTHAHLCMCYPRLLCDA